MQAERAQLRIVFTLVVAAWVLALPALCNAQWVPSPGEGTVSLGYQYTRVTDHLFSVDMSGITTRRGYVGGPGNHMYLGDIFGQTVNLSADFGVWRGLAVSASAAYVSSRYSGKARENPEVDDGHYHGRLQDGTFGVQYMIPWKQFAITPSVGARFPLKEYSVVGHTSAGKKLYELPIGISVGRSLGPLLPRAYLGASFAYSFVENHHEHSLDQRHYGLSGGYILTNSISVGGVLRYLKTVDGIDWFTDINSQEAFHDHDAAAKAEYLRAGGYVSFSLGRSFSLTLSYLGTISGENTHSAQSVTITPTWSFRAPLFAR